ncbi:unnamed protein product [Microthlaspi erraticum]|uniref:Uncharacterized protein n=1 Tax=Microthlaspi erraticum TaxID=1685480 RepID=A0A6D2L397_9BRAS|nr:unnamed protein product [Microthlaspi erraticum]
MDKDVMMKEVVEASDIDTFSVTALDVALPSPENERSRSGCSDATDPAQLAVYDPFHPPPDLISPSFYDYVPWEQLESQGCAAPGYKISYLPPSPPSPGIIQVEETFLGSYEEQAKDAKLVETRDKLLTSGSGQGNYYRTVILGAEDPTGNIKCKFLTRVHLAEENEGCFTVHTLDARKLPLDGFSQNWHHGPSSLWMPVWLPKNAVDKPQYYEMNDSDVQENKDWLLVYAELALYSWFGYGFRYLDALPLEVVKVFVQTTEDVEPAKAKNAIFYITFKTVAGREYNGIIKRATDGRPDRFSLEATCPMF